MERVEKFAADCFHDDQSLARELEALKKQANRISVESESRPGNPLSKRNLYDQLWLFTHPMLVSNGERLFTLADKQQSLQPLSTKTYTIRTVQLDCIY